MCQCRKLEQISGNVLARFKLQHILTLGSGLSSCALALSSASTRDGLGTTPPLRLHHGSLMVLASFSSFLLPFGAILDVHFNLFSFEGQEILLLLLYFCLIVEFLDNQM